MLLSIGMIVKNEEKWLDKCLSAIRPILDAVDSELIITDTGSTDRTVEIAKKYTDKVLHFDWIDDFSAARNTVFSIAKGEWFMFLDADDIFKSCNGIIDFFNSGKYKNYNSAAYTSHNLTGNGDTFVDYRAPRLTKITPETKFEGIIHEHLNTFGEPLKNIYDIALHYGYLYETESDRQKKFERNSVLLLKKLEQNGNKDPILYSELFQCYAGHDMEKAIGFLDAGIKVCYEQKHFLITVMYSLKAFLYYTENNFEETLRICDGYFNIDAYIKPKVTAIDAEIYAIKAEALYKMKLFKEAVVAFKYYFVVFEEVRAGRIHTSDMYAAQFYMATESNYIRFMCDFLKCAVNSGQHKEILTFISNYPPTKYSYEKNELTEFIDLEAKLISGAGNDYYDLCYNGLDEYGKRLLEQKIIESDSTRHIVLTIGMIVKNEEKWLDKCLSAIKPILDNIDSELIITDTGSTDRTVEIAKKYTDKVLHFDWIDDFSAARNFGLEKAQGEWFMMLDADDIFRSCEHIIEFFNSGDYKNYNSASYISRNFAKSAENEMIYSDFRAPRMVKISPETRYTGIVHEYLTTFTAPYKNISDIADHFGYYYEDDNAKIKKAKRNIELLLNAYESGDNISLMLFTQLYSSYLALGDCETALKYLNEGLERAKKSDSISKTALYFHKACYYHSENRYEEAIAVCDEYYSVSGSIRNGKIWTDCEMYGIRSESLYAQGKYVEAVSDYKIFFDILKDISSGKLFTYDAYLIDKYITGDMVIPFLVRHFIESCIRSGNLNTADEFLCTYPTEQYLFEQNQIYGFAKSIIEFCESFSYKNIKDYYNHLDDNVKELLSSSLFCRLLCDPDKEKIIKPLSELSVYSENIKSKLDIYTEFMSQKNVSHNIAEYVIKYGAVDNFDLICLLFIGKYDISVILDMNDVDMEKCVYLCCRNMEDFYDAVENYPIDCISDESKLNRAVKFIEQCIILKLIDNEEKSNEEKELLIKKLFEKKRSLSLRSDRSKKTQMSEFEMLSAQIKRNIRTFIDAGNIDAAYKTLYDYQKISPDDKEISELISLIQKTEKKE